MTMTKLNEIACVAALISLPGNFRAVEAYCTQYENPGGWHARIGTLAAALVAGVEEFYSPILPRGARFNTADEVWEADLGVQVVRIVPMPEAKDPEIIVSGHAGTRNFLARKFSEAVIIEGNVSEDDITGKVVAGTLPPHLVASAAAYVQASIKGFDYAKDGDLNGDELRKRLVIYPAICVTVG